jgi:hypothetical protein
VVSLIGCQPSRLGLAGTQEDLSGGLAAAARLTDKAQAAKLGHVAFAATESVGRHLRLAAALSALDAERIHPAHVEAMQVRRHGHTRTPQCAVPLLHLINDNGIPPYRKP